MDSAEVEIRALTVDDLEGAYHLSSTAEWNERRADWRRLLQLAPAGCFAAVSADHVVGTAIGIDYRSFGWIAMMLVEPTWRGRGIGARLLARAVDHLPAGNPIRLDATPLGRRLYLRFGFEDEALLTRHVARSGHGVDQPRDERYRHVRRLTAADLHGVAARDALVFGARRQAILEWTLEDGAEYAQLIHAGGTAHYCFGRPGRLFDQIGPVVASDDDLARALVHAALDTARPKAVIVDSFDRREGFGAWLRQSGFTAERPLIRMRRARPGSTPESGPGSPPFDEFAILGPEFG